MNNLTIQPLDPSHAAALVELQSAYSRVYVDAPVIPKEVYLSPAFEDGQNIFGAFDECGNLVGYAPLVPVLRRDLGSRQPHTLWTEIKTDPAEAASNEIKDRLFEKILMRAREVTDAFPGHPIHLTFQYFLSETASIEYVLSKGCRHTDSVFTMRRDLSKAIPAPLPVPGIALQPWRMESEAEQRCYVDARNECFPEIPVGLREWQYFMQSPQWFVGTTIAAFEGEDLVGNVAVFWDEAENQCSGKQIGFTEYIFVRPRWQGRNIARSLINTGLAHLRQQGLAEAQLEVRARNEGALHLYVDLGYEILRESRFYTLEL